MKCPQCSHTSLLHQRAVHHWLTDIPFIFRKEHILKCRHCGIFFKHQSPYPIILIIGIGFAPAIILMKDNFMAGSIMLAALIVGFIGCAFAAPLFLNNRIHFNTALLESYSDFRKKHHESSYELKKLYIGRWQVEHCNIA